MNSKSFSLALIYLCAALTLGLCLFGGTPVFLFDGFFGPIFYDILAAIRDPQTQWLILLCICFYFIILMLLQSRQKAVAFRYLNAPELWLIAAFVMAVFSYFIDYPDSTQSTQLLTLFAGAALGKGVGVWAGFKSKGHKNEVEINKKTLRGNDFVVLVESLLVILLTLASIWHPSAGRHFEYHDNARWSGFWSNPNTFGLLMGTGIMLAAGQFVQSLTSIAQRQNAERRRWIRKYALVILCCFAAILTARGLLHSYSRGAWLATGCGMVYLIGVRFWCLASGGNHEPSQISTYSTLNPQPSTATPNCFNRNWLPLVVIIFCVGILSFWHSRQTEWYPARRAFSIGNQNDFSWRNRLLAWEGALQITAEHPLFGTGWNQPEPMYEHFYLPPKSMDGAAIEMNDYLMLNDTLGIPALFCFGMYLWLSLKQKSESGIQNPESAKANWPQTTCRAGAIVLLVGFWFDGGLFTLPTAATFWILLELGSVELYQGAAKSAK